MYWLPSVILKQKRKIKFRFIYLNTLMNVIAALAFIIFFNGDSIFLMILRMAGGSSKTSWPKVAQRFDPRGLSSGAI
jgi:hypothetical protein